FAFDPATGAERWRLPRGQARVLGETEAGLVLLAGDRVTGIDRATGLARFRGEALGGTALAPPLVSSKEAVVPVAAALVTVSLEDGRALGRYRFERPPLEAGALAAAGPGRIATASYARANV